MSESSGNRGFRGEIVQITDIHIAGSPQGPVVKFRALFEDTEGVVHATSNHEISIDSDDAMMTAVRDLTLACRTKTERLHFVDPSNPERVSIRGIAEAISGSADPSDEPGESG